MTVLPQSPSEIDLRIIGPEVITTRLGIEMGAREMRAGARKPDFPAVFCPEISLLDIINRKPELIRNSDWLPRMPFAKQKMPLSWLQYDWGRRVVSQGSTLEKLLQSKLRPNFRPTITVESVWLGLLIPEMFAQESSRSLITSESEGESVISVQLEASGPRSQWLTIMGQWKGSLSHSGFLLPVQTVPIRKL